MSITNFQRLSSFCTTFAVFIILQELNEFQAVFLVLQQFHHFQSFFSMLCNHLSMHFPSLLSFSVFAVVYHHASYLTFYVFIMFHHVSTVFIIYYQFHICHHESHHIARSKEAEENTCGNFVPSFANGGLPTALADFLQSTFTQTFVVMFPFPAQLIPIMACFVMFHLYVCMVFLHIQYFRSYSHVSINFIIFHRISFHSFSSFLMKVNHVHDLASFFIISMIFIISNEYS